MSTIGRDRQGAHRQHRQHQHRVDEQRQPQAADHPAPGIGTPPQPADDGRSPGREQDRIEAGQVVRLAAGDQEHQREEPVRDREAADRPELGRPPEPDQTGYPDRHQHRADQHQLHRQEQPPRLGRARAAAGDRPRQGELRPPVVGLPEQVRQPDERRPGRHPATARPNGGPTARPHGQQSDQHGGDQCRDQRLVVQGDPDHQSDQQPAARIGALELSHHQEADQGPEQQVERGRAQHVTEDQQDRGDGHRRRGQQLARPVSAHPPRQQPGEQHHRTGGQGRRQPPADQRVAEQPR